MVPLERLSIEPMANGWSCILLTEAIAWEQFPPYASAIAQLIGGQLRQLVDAPDTRMRGLFVGQRPFRMVFDHFPLGVTIEPRTNQAHEAIPRLHDSLDALKQRQDS